MSGLKSKSQNVSFTSFLSFALYYALLSFAVTTQKLKYTSFCFCVLNIPYEVLKAKNAIDAFYGVPVCLQRILKGHIVSVILRWQISALLGCCIQKSFEALSNITASSSLVTLSCQR